MKEITIESYINNPDLKEARKRTSNSTNIIEFDINQLSNKQLGKDKKYFIKTFGCQMNVNDSEKMSAILEEMGYSLTEDAFDADIVMLNTCAVRENAENKVFGFIGSLKVRKQENPDMIICLCGCMSQEEDVVKTVYEKYPQVDLIFGTHNIHRLPVLIQEVLFSKDKLTEVWSNEGDIVENLPIKRDFKHKAWITIMYGCDRFCTYCIVPYTRGKERSRLPIDIINEAKQLIAEGYQEITLLGQNVNSYGLDLEEKSSLKELLEEIANLNIPRLRFTTSNPWNFSDELIEIFTKYPNIMPYIHLPIQSGNDEILKLMGRRHTGAEYKLLIDKIKKAIPNVSITTDIIVGFPNETQEQFNDTLEMVKYVEYDCAYTFIYSKRKGTPADKMEDNVSLEEKKQRLQQLNELVNIYALKANSKYMDQTVDVLVDGVSKKNQHTLSGYTPQNKVVNFEASPDLIGKIVKVKITKVNTWSLYGQLV